MKDFEQILTQALKGKDIAAEIIGRAMSHDILDQQEKQVLLKATIETPISKDNAQILYLRGKTYLCGYRIEKNLSKEKAKEKAYANALDCFKKASDKEHIPSMCVLATMYEDGKGCKKNLSAATALLEKAIKSNSALAMHNRAMMHVENKEYSQAFDLLTSAANLSDSHAMEALALGHFKKYWKDHSIQQAIDWSKKAILFGRGTAIKYLNAIHTSDQHNKPYLEDAILFRKAYNYSKEYYTFYEGSFLKELQNLATKKNDTNYFALQYHYAMTHWKQNDSFSEIDKVIKTNPNKFLEIVATDELLSEAEQLKMANLAIKNSPNLLTSKDQATTNLLDKYWKQTAENFLTKQNSLLAIWAYQNVSKTSAQYGNACCNIAVSLLQKSKTSFAEKKAEEANATEEYAKTYFEKAIYHSPCNLVYKFLYEAYLIKISEGNRHNDHNPISTEDLEMLLLVKQLTTIMKAIYTATQHILRIQAAEKKLINPDHIAIQMVTSVANYFGVPQEKHITIKNCLSQAKTIAIKGLTKLKQSDKSHTSLLNIANNFLQEVQKFKNEFPKTITNTLQSIIDLEEKLNELIIGLKKKIEPTNVQTTNSVDNSCSVSSLRF